MTLLLAVTRLKSFSLEDTIYAAEPWSLTSEARVIPEHPAMMVHQGRAYFLEVSICREFLEGWNAIQPIPASLEDQCLRLIQYATNDA
jgi:hypothetical protein